MPLQIVRNDITKMKVDAIVNAANASLLGGGGVDGCIHRAAGPALLAECRTLGGCETGSAKLTGAGELPCQYVIHAVGPRWQGGRHGEREKLISCYRTSLELAKDKGCVSLAFPLISSGIYGYPKDQALRIAVDTIGEFLLENDMTVYLVIFDKASYQISGKLFAEITEYVDDHYVEEHTDRTPRRVRQLNETEESVFREMDALQEPAKTYTAPPPTAKTTRSGKIRLPFTAKKPRTDTDQQPFAAGSAQAEAVRAPSQAAPALPSSAPTTQFSLGDALKQLDESFSEMLLRKIDESGMTDSECYKKANIDRKLFSKIRSDKQYKPSKPTVIAFAIALELSLTETQDMLRKAGFALSHSHKFDIIIEYFIKAQNYNIFEINEALFAFDQRLLGA